MKIERFISLLEVLAIIGILTVGFLQACSVTFGKPIISIVLWPTIFLSSILLLIRLFYFRLYGLSKNMLLLTAFCISYILSMLNTIQYGWYDNLRTLIWCAFLFFLVYCYNPKNTYFTKEKQYITLSIYYVVINAVLSFLSFYTMYTGKSQIFYQEIGPIYYIGFHWGRLYGIYWDANIGAVMSCIGILLSIGLFKIKKSKLIRILLIINIFLQIFYITFSDSRTGHLCLCIGSITWIFLEMKEKKSFVFVKTIENSFLNVRPRGSA